MTADAFATWCALLDGTEGMALDKNPADDGNWTGGRQGVGELRGSKRGISAAAFPTLDIANLGDADIAAIRRNRYWLPVAADSLPGPIAIFLADEAYNQGVGAAVRDLQAVLGVTVDGVLGRLTVAAAAARPVDDLLTELVAARAWRYAQASKIATFGRGWMRRLALAATAAYRF